MAKKSKKNSLGRPDINTDKYFTDKNIISDIAKELNKSEKIAYTLGTGDAPSTVKEWIPTGIKVLDVCISNKKQGGFPTGRIIEVIGENSAGKTLIGMLTAKKVQEMNGYVLWIDTENSFSETLAELVGLKFGTDNKFLYTQPDCLDEVFSIIEKVLIQLRTQDPDGLILIVWDSVAATPPRAELENDYEDQTIALAAREMSRGFRRISKMIGKLRSTAMCLNQVRTNIGNPYQPLATSHGKALGFYSDIRIELRVGSQIKDGDNNKIGNIIKAKTIKNRVGPPFRAVEFSMYYTKGIDEYDSVYDILVKAGYIKSGAWVKINDEKYPDSYRKTDIINMLKYDEEFKEKAMKIFYDTMIKDYSSEEEHIVDEEGNVVDPQTGNILYSPKKTKRSKEEKIDDFVDEQFEVSKDGKEEDVDKEINSKSKKQS